MHESVKNNLIDKADGIFKFRELAIEEQAWLFPLLSKGIRSSLEILDLIAEQPMTYEDIAAELDMNDQTIRQKLNALALGGYPLELSETKAFAPTGRPRKLARASKNGGK